VWLTFYSISLKQFNHAALLNSTSASSSSLVSAQFNTTRSTERHEVFYAASKKNFFWVFQGRHGKGFKLRACFLQVFVKKSSYPALIIGSQLTVGGPVVEPKFSAGILCQCFPQRLRMGKGYHGISRGMD
jgi:hypothetical protein